MYCMLCNGHQRVMLHHVHALLRAKAAMLVLPNHAPAQLTCRFTEWRLPGIMCGCVCVWRMALSNRLHLRMSRAPHRHEGAAKVLGKNTCIVMRQCHLLSSSMSQLSRARLCWATNVCTVASCTRETSDTRAPPAPCYTSSPPPGTHTPTRTKPRDRVLVRPSDGCGRQPLPAVPAPMPVPDTCPLVAAAGAAAEGV